MKFLRSFLLLTCLATAFVSCQKVLDFENGLAKGNLMKAASGDCMPVTINGTFKKDTLLNATNYVDVQVNITRTGLYILKTDTLNGYSFSATGTAALTGLNTIRLLASGRPVSAALDVFKVKFDSSICEFNIIVTGTGGGGMPIGNDTLTAFVNNVYTEFNDTPVALSITTNGVTLLTINGFSTSSTNNDAMSVGVSKTGSITSGSYNVNTIPLPTAVGTYTDPTGNNTFVTFFMGVPQINPLTITIQSVSATRVKGSFSGRFYDNSGMGPGFVTVTNGYFNVPIF